MDGPAAAARATGVCGDAPAPAPPSPPCCRLASAAAAGVLEGKVDRACQVDLPGGPLHIEWREADNHIYMTGPAQLVFGGELSLA